MRRSSHPFQYYLFIDLILFILPTKIKILWIDSNHVYNNQTGQRNVQKETQNLITFNYLSSKKGNGLTKDINETFLIVKSFHSLSLLMSETICVTKEAVVL